MRIKRFRAEKIYGRIDFDIRFNDNLNFLVGINGSGKTTILRSLSALISPSLISLAYLDYKLIEVEIRHKRKKIIITTTKNDNKLKMFNNQIKEELEVQMYPQDEPIYRQPRLEDRQLEYYREEENRMANHPVMQSIRSLPSPMLLGIERRSRELFAPEERPQDIGHFTGQRYVRRGYVRYRNIFGNTLYDSLTEAEELASVVFSDIQRRQFIATEELRRNILLSSFMYEEIETTTKYSFRDVYERAIDTEKQMFDTFLELHIPQRELDNHLTPFFDKLKRIGEVLKNETDLTELLDSKDHEKRSAALDWFINYPQFVRINDIADYISSYVTRRQQ